MKYRPEIDGLRAIAVIAVIVFHLNASWLPGGFIGVDIFFVISGFLITKIFIRNFNENNFNILEFWSKRIRRLLPALLFLIFLVSSYSYLFIYYGEWPSISLQTLTTLGSIANLEMWKHANDYWGASAEKTPLLHMWSLAVEEQFYLVYPIFFIIFYKIGGMKMIKYALAILTFISLVLCVIITYRDVSLAFYMLPTRAWELGVGGLVALISKAHKKDNNHLKLFQYIGFSLILISSIFISAQEFPGYKAILPVLGTALFIYSSPSSSWLNSFLSSKLLVWIGRLSYSLYLWHWPVIVFMQKHSSFLGTKNTYILSILIFLTLAIISYYFVEKIWRYKKSKQSYLCIGLGFIICMIFGFFLYFYNPPALKEYKKVYWYGELYSNNTGGKRGILDRAKYREIVRPMKSKSLDLSYESGGVIKAYGDHKIDIMVLGSSHGQMWSSTIDNIAKELYVDVSFYSVGGVKSVFKIEDLKDNPKTYLEKFNKSRYDYFKKWKPKVIFILERWSVVGYSKVELIEFLEVFNNGYTQVVFLSEPACLKEAYYSSLKLLAHYKAPIDATFSIKNFYINERRHMHLVLDEIANKLEYVHYVNLEAYYFDDSSHEFGFFVENGQLLYIDDNHLSHYGAMKSKEAIKQKLINLIHLNQ